MIITVARADNHYNYYNSLCRYEAFMAWGIGLRHLKMLAENSLIYSGIPSADKEDAIENMWRPLWDQYIVDMKDEACGAELDQDEPLFSRILPRVGPAEITTNVHVFGRHFESAICRNVTCMFGTEISASAVYQTNQHILCEAPSLSEDVLEHLRNPLTVPVYVSLGGDFLDTGETFTYHPGIIPTK